MPFLQCVGSSCGVAVLLLLSNGCAPTTPYRNTAYVPAVRPIPFDGRTAPPGTLRVEGTVTASGVSENLTPTVGSTALFVPSWTAEGSMMLAIGKHLEIGARAAYADYAWRQASTVGTMPLPGAPSSWGFGPEVRLSFPLDEEKRFALGLAGNLVYYSVPFAEWQLSAASASTSACTPFNAPESCYTLAHTDSEGHFVYSLGVFPSYAFGQHGEYGHLFAALAVTNGFSNVGFAQQATNASTVDETGPIGVVGAGYGLSVDMFRVSGLVYWPVTTLSSPVAYGPAAMLTVGVDVPLLARD